jgi:hypothetical protein
VNQNVRFIFRALSHDKCQSDFHYLLYKA